MVVQQNGSKQALQFTHLHVHFIWGWKFQLESWLFVQLGSCQLPTCLHLPSKLSGFYRVFMMPWTWRPLLRRRIKPMRSENMLFNKWKGEKKWFILLPVFRWLLLLIASLRSWLNFHTISDIPILPMLNQERMKAEESKQASNDPLYHVMFGITWHFTWRIMMDHGELFTIDALFDRNKFPKAAKGCVPPHVLDQLKALSLKLSKFAMLMSNLRDPVDYNVYNLWHNTMSIDMIIPWYDGVGFICTSFSRSH